MKASKKTLLVVDFCGTLSESVARFDVGHHLQKHGFDGKEEANYWEMVTDTWGSCSVGGEGWATVMQNQWGKGSDEFVKDYWKAHTVDDEWVELLKGRHVGVAVSAVYGNVKKDRGFWDSLFTTDTTNHDFIIATDHYSDAFPAISSALPTTSSLLTPPTTRPDPHHFPYERLVLVDDFGRAENPLSNYHERSAQTANVVRSSLPSHCDLHVVNYTGTHDIQKVKELL
eukprot:TRINITY_DN947_c1_g1_i1.p1 TRINITY_DN947_c1_g1~~TRINITY_DN947_c1_g1_i1.p1  ORF type:complete len:245 (+),score=50.44 TRINITY_DN947_c1_g1_i1:52-735(+)